MTKLYVLWCGFCWAKNSIKRQILFFFYKKPDWCLISQALRANNYFNLFFKRWKQNCFELWLKWFLVVKLRISWYVIWKCLKTRQSEFIKIPFRLKTEWFCDALIFKSKRFSCKMQNHFVIFVCKIIQKPKNVNYLNSALIPFISALFMEAISYQKHTSTYFCFIEIHSDEKEIKTRNFYFDVRKKYK